MAGALVKDKIRVAVVGASGYGGGEMLRLLHGHPVFEVTAAASRSRAGRPVSDAHPNLLGVSSLAFTDRPAPELAREADALLFGLPHGEAAAVMPRVLEAAPEIRIVDLSGDFRLDDAAAWEAAYGRAHPAPDLLREFTYGLVEDRRDEIAAARRIANPGCFATGSILALLPLAQAGILRGDFVVNGVTGSSGSGAHAKETTHHPERAEDYRAYRALSHQHAPEIAMALAAAGAEGPRPALVAHSAPFVRGIFTTAYVFPKEPVTPARLREIYKSRYGPEPFVRLRDGTPRLATVRGTNWCDIAVAAREDGGVLTVLSAIDNLVKGMAGQAVQNLNILFGLEETEGLLLTGMHP